MNERQNNRGLTCAKRAKIVRKALGNMMYAVVALVVAGRTAVV